MSAVLNAARGASDAQRLINDLAIDEPAAGRLWAHLAAAIEAEGATYLQAFTRELEKRLQRPEQHGGST